MYIKKLPDTPNLLWISTVAEGAIANLKGAPFSGPSLSLATRVVIDPGSWFSRQTTGAGCKINDIASSRTNI